MLLAGRLKNNLLINNQTIHWFFSSADKHGTGRFLDSSLSQVWEDHFDLIINDYISSVYVDVMETFIGASIKVDIRSTSQNVFVFSILCKFILIYPPHVSFYFQLFGWAAFGTFLVMKGAWLNSRDGESSYNSYNSPQYHHNGRTIVSKTLTESFLGVQNSSGPLNFTLPYVEDYLVSAGGDTSANDYPPTIIDIISGTEGSDLSGWQFSAGVLRWQELVC